MTQEEINAWQRVKRKENGNAHTKKYEKTPKGFLMRCYRNMQSRITGVQKAKFHLYVDKELLARQDFYNWSLSNDTFWDLYDEWVASGYERRLTPSVDRIDSDKGYDISNMEWVTHSENSRRGALSPKRAIHHRTAEIRNGAVLL